MENISQIATYFFVFVFIIGFVSRLVKYSRMPVHLRWELYPIAGETKRPWGGSYLEESEWWKKPVEEKSFFGEIKFMAQEILCFREYFKRNRSLWYIVYPFHIGIFLFAGFFLLLVIGSLMLLGDVVISGESASFWGKLVYYLTLATGGTALVVGAAGCFALLIRKVVDSNMRPYTRRIEYFNIMLVLGIFITGICSWAFADSTFSTARDFTRGLITLGDAGSMDGIIISHIILIGLFLAYLPFTNMMHFFMKHFTYNSVRWDDVPHLRGNRIELQLQPLLAQPVSWAAPHIEGINRWSDISGSQTADRKEGTKHAKKTDQTQ